VRLAGVDVREARANVVYAEPNVVESAQGLPTPNDPAYGAQSALTATNALAGWSAAPGSFGAPSAPQPAIAVTAT
jgi:hypothetical protein